MADKRQAHHWWRILRRVKVWQLLILLIVFGVASVELLRQNNLSMLEHRNLVTMADEQGDNQKIQTALNDLRIYITSHMNTGMGDTGVYLNKTYQRAYDRAVQEGIQNNSASRDLYNQADAACQAVFNKTYSFPAYTQCVAGKLSAQAGGNDPLNSVKAPSVDLYRYNFVSPLWSPDAAGIAVAITVLLMLLVLGRIVLVWLLWLILRHHKRWA